MFPAPHAIFRFMATRQGSLATTLVMFSGFMETQEQWGRYSYISEKIRTTRKWLTKDYFKSSVTTMEEASGNETEKEWVLELRITGGLWEPWRRKKVEYTGGH